MRILIQNLVLWSCLSSLSLLTACGQKGELYLPDDATLEKPPSTRSTPAPTPTKAVAPANDVVSPTTHSPD